MAIEETKVFGLRVRIRDRAPEDAVELVALAVRDRENRHHRPVVRHEDQNYFNVYALVQESPGAAEIEFLYRQSRPGPHAGWNCYRWYKPFLCRHPRDAHHFLDFRAVVSERQTVSAFCYTQNFRLLGAPNRLLGRPISEFFAAELAAMVQGAISVAEPGGDPARLFFEDIPGLPALWITRHESGGAEILARTTFTLPDIVGPAPVRPPRPVSFRLGRRNGLRLVWSREEANPGAAWW